VAIVARRFWPLAGGPEKVLANLAVELTARGSPALVLTARWRANWPSEILLRGVPVIRLPPPAEQRWGSLRRLRPLVGWLRANRHRYDVVYVSELKEEAYVIMRAVGGRMPIVLRAERSGRGGDCQWQRDAVCGGRIAAQCRRAAAVIAPAAEIERELLAAGYCPALVRRVPNGVPEAPPRTPQARLAARTLLAEANQELQLPDTAPLAVYLGRLEAGCGLERLLETWTIILRRWPNARLWLIGEGSLRRALVRRIETLNLAGRAWVVGRFDEVDAVLAAADVFLRPTPDGDSGVALLEAFAAGLPVVASDTAGHREWIAAEQNGLLAPAFPTAWATAVGRLLEDPGLAARLGQAARRKAAEHCLAGMVGMHLTLFQELHP
jgi:glycosyltransferase involved in cell wall biosynthesis